MKRCACGATYTADGWAALPFVTNHNAPSGEIDSAGVRLQFRLCRCGSTLAVALGEDLQSKMLTDAELTERLRDIQRRGLGDHAADLREHIAALTPPTTEAVARDYETVRGALSLLESDDVGQRTEGTAALDRLRDGAARVPGLVASLKASLENTEEANEALKRTTDGLAAAADDAAAARAERDAARGNADDWKVCAEREVALRETAEKERDAALRREEAVSDHLQMMGVSSMETLADDFARLQKERDAARERAAVLEQSERDLGGHVANLEKVLAAERESLRLCREGAESFRAERDAARQEVAKHRLDLEDVRTALAHERATVDTLTARVAELEREKDERRRGLQTMQDIVNEAVSAREAAERDLREMTAAKERATEAYRQAEQQRFSAEAKLAGLLEAVGPVNPDNLLGPSLCRRLRKADMQGAQYTLDAQEVACVVRLLAMLHERLAAYDAAKGGEAVEKGRVVRALRAEAFHWGCPVSARRIATSLGLSLDTPPSGPGCGEREVPRAATLEDFNNGVVGLTTEHPEPTISVAALAAVVEMVADEASSEYMTPGVRGQRKWRSYGRIDGAREVFRRVKVGEVPRVLTEARVVEVLGRLAAQGSTEFRRAAAYAARDLGVTLPETEPSGPPSPRVRRPEPTPECPALNPVPGFPMPPAAVLEAITKRTRAYHGDRTCGACTGPLETSRDAVCESCAPELLAHTYAESMAPTEPGLSAPSTLEANLKPGSNSTPEVVFCAKGVTVNADGSYSQEPGFHMYEVVDALARALAEARRELADMRKAHNAVQYANANRSWATAGGDVIAIHAERLEKDAAEAERKAAESMRERAAKAVDTASVCTRGYIADLIRDLPLEDE